ncbi:MAG TPA: SDR family oxidoreductase, partial [Mycobacterium sp.]
MAPTDTSLKGKVAIVTGASSGIGAEICRELSQWGASVVLVGRDATRLDDVLADLTSSGGDAHRLCVDVTEEAAPEQIVAETLARFGAVDILVHAAGIFLPTPFTETSDADLDAQWSVNVRAPFRLTRSAAGHLGDGSAVIFVSSICGHVGFPNSSAYCATKGAV